MADIAPLTPLRYDLDKIRLDRVVAPPYDVIDEAGRTELEERHPKNVVRLILPRGDGDARYANAAALLAAWSKEGTLTRDREPGFYRYEQTFSPPGDVTKRITRRGFLGLVRLQPFADRVILPHERTLSGPKEDRLKLFRATETNLSPGFMLYRDPRHLLDAPLDTGRLLAKFSTEDGVHHALSKVTSHDALQAIVEHLQTTSLLIADGHHRYETALRYAEEVTQARTGASPRGAHLYFMVFLCNEDDPNLRVFATHRHVHSLGKPVTRALLDELKSWFVVDENVPRDVSTMIPRLQAAGQTRPALGVLLRDGNAAILTLRSDRNLADHPTLSKTPEVLRHTDVAVLHRGILSQVLGITPEAEAAKTNIWYPQDAALAERELRGGKGDALFILNPTPVNVVRRVAEAGEVMPQKSTFFYPKVLTGLCIHTLEPDRVVPAI